MKRHRLWAFFLITFAITWGVPGAALLFSRLVDSLSVDVSEYTPLYYLAVWSPAIAAFLVIGATQGGAGVRAFARRLLHWRVDWRWYALVLLGMPTLYLCGAALTQAFGVPALSVPAGPWSAFVLAALLRASAGPVEEIGWRGYALPLLQRRSSALQAAIILGLIWGVWHVPAFVVSGLYHSGQELPIWLGIARFLLQTVALSVILTAIYNGTGGSVPVAFLVHWLGNFPYPWEGPADAFTAQTALLTLAAILAVVMGGRRYLGDQNRFTEPTPGVPLGINSEAWAGRE